jgi:hypothetical protein
VRHSEFRTLPLEEIHELPHTAEKRHHSAQHLGRSTMTDAYAASYRPFQNRMLKLISLLPYSSKLFLSVTLSMRDWLPAAMGSHLTQPSNFRSALPRNE